MLCKHLTGRRHRIEILNVRHAEDQSVQARIKVHSNFLSYGFGIAESDALPEARLVHPPCRAVFRSLALGLGLGGSDDQDTQGGLDDLFRIAAHGFTMAGKDLHLMPERFHIPKDVAHVGVPGDETQGAVLAVTPDQDRRSAGLHGAGAVQDLMNPVVTTLKAGSLLGKHGPAYLQRLLKPVHALAHRGKIKAVTSVFFLVPR